MDKGTITGCFLGLGFLSIAVILSGPEQLLLFWNTPSLLIIAGGAIAAGLIAFPLKNVLKSITYIRKCFVRQEIDPYTVIEQIISLSESARRNGLLALEYRIDEIRDPYLADGLRMVVDGMAPNAVEKILRSEIEAMNARHQQGRAVIVHYGKLTPAFGMIGTLVGLVMMFAHLEPESIGPGMAVAILTTLYGAVAAYLFLLPIAEKLGEINKTEIQNREMILNGLLAMQAGEHPRIIRLKLLTYLPPDERPGDDYHFPERIVAEDIEPNEEKIAA